ncbi:MAG: UvrD-helicase domain-containing protein [Pirellulaceae bacterium]|nr:UvrD-helicase domain-containing protein [Pirellulaceae bacterium]
MNNQSTNSIAIDSRTRERISKELRTNFLVEAAAGTGKTTKIVDRMVNLIATGECEIDHLVAVTFTRKAAAELRARFEAGLRAGAYDAGKDFDLVARQRMQDACNRSNQAFVGTIHSFCASLLRERPIEFEVDPQFRELTESDDQQLKEDAWHSNIRNLLATEDPLLERMNELGIVRSQLKHCFHQIVANRDIEQWPVSDPQTLNLPRLRQEMQDYIDHMRTLAPAFPDDRGNDGLMNRYEEIIRASQRDWLQPAGLIRMLEKFDSTTSVVQSAWVDKLVGKAEKTKWENFRERVAKPALAYWYGRRYPLVVEFVRRAAAIYERDKKSHGGLDFTDLMLRVASGLRAQPELRAYFRTRYTRILVDEFQDTDPVQAEMLMLLCSEDHQQQDWNQCKLRPGSLFLVGDPKQAIYRFRRGDIVTYNRMRDLIQQSGEVLPLAKNFRSQACLIEWNNEVYRKLFGTQATAYSPASEDMLHGRQEDEALTTSSPQVPVLSGLFTLPVAKHRNSVDTEGEADAIARVIRHAIDGGMHIPRTKSELQAGKTTAAEPRDFLIIPPRKSSIRTYKAALDRYGIPCDVTGGNATDGIEELQLLTVVLQCVDDPYDQISFLSLLRNQLFGFDDQELYTLKQQGIPFVYSAPQEPNSKSSAIGQRYASVCETLSNYARWLRSLPYAVGVTRIAEDLGLLAKAAARADGDVAAGGFLKAIEWLRQRSNDFDSIADVVGSLDELLEADEFEDGTALSPNTNVVRLMNLHKAKGLEAPVVFLADIGNESQFPVHAHIDRSSGNRADEARGYVSVQHEIKHPWGKSFKPIACPVGWPPFEEKEGRFLAAEKDRLLYVATTRAGCGLIISTGNDKSVWAKLYPYLDAAPKLQIPNLAGDVSQSSTSDAASKTQFEPRLAAPAAITARWQEARLGSYAINSAKDLGLKGVRRPKWETTGEYGYRWGSAVHELLELRTKSPEAELRAAAVNLAHEYGLQHDRIDELIGTVESVTRSDVWQRAQAALRRYSELPFETLVNDDDRPTIIRGVIDLIFEEPSGWVIVDYKTDDISSSDIPAAISYYQSQLQQYSKHWTNITGNSIQELGLYFTKLNRYEVVP